MLIFVQRISVELLQRQSATSHWPLLTFSVEVFFFPIELCVENKPMKTGQCTLWIIQDDVV